MTDDQLPTDGTTPVSDSTTISASAIISSTPIAIPEKKPIFNLPETIIIVLMVVLFIHFGLAPKHTTPVKVKESIKVATVVKGPKAVIKVTPVRPSQVEPKSKAQVKTEKKQKRNDHSFSGPMGH